MLLCGLYLILSFLLMNRMCLFAWLVTQALESALTKTFIFNMYLIFKVKNYGKSSKICRHS